MDDRPDQVRRQETPDEGARRKLSRERGEINPNPSTAEDELEEMRLELARTRAQMSETVYALQERANPQYVREQAISQAKDSAREAGSSMASTVKENPVPAALTGVGLVGLGWLVASARKTSSGQQGSAQQGAPLGPRYYGSTEDYAERSYPTHYEDRELDREFEIREPERSSQGAESQGTGDGARERAGQIGGQLQGRARDAGGQAQERAGQAGRQAQQQAQRAKDGFQRVLQESPLALGALAAGIGAAVAFVVPATSKENEAMGETRDNLVERGKEAARGQRQKAQRVLEEGRSSAEQEARNQGLVE
jgi:hypothetical protein